MLLGRPDIVDHDLDWGLGARVGGLYPLLGEGIFTQDGRDWQHSREILRRQFVRIQYQNLKVFDRHIHELIEGLSRAGNGIVDLQPYFFRFTLGTTNDLIFGERAGRMDDDLQDTFSDSFDYASSISAIRLRLANFHWLYMTKKFKSACGVVKKYASHIVSQALEIQEHHSSDSSRGHPFILDLYKHLKNPNLVRDQLIHVLVAGRDTTACLMSWTL